MLTLEYANCLADRVGVHGLDPDLFEPGAELDAACRHLTDRLSQSRGKGWERWRELPFGSFRDGHVRGVHEIVERVRGRFDNLVVLGIGGSALGNTALQKALNPSTYNLLDAVERSGPRLFVVDNVDPSLLSAVLNICERQGGLERTLFNVISKSGETAETAAQFMVVRDRLKQRFGARHAEHVIAITDPAKGTMRTICDAEGYATLPVPDGVGGRFSVLSPVGLFSAAMCGIDIDALLDGAASMDMACREHELSKNPAAMLAALLVELAARKGKPNHVLMPYSNALYGLADWYRQLWAESLGKQRDVRGEEVFAGFTPIKALGATDQHSQIQLYREGPNDKVIGLIEVATFGDDEVTIPRGLGVEAIAYLEGATMGGLLNAERRATEFALVESQRPNYTIRFPRIDAHHVGEFIQLWQVATAYAGLMLNVDAYDQPAVELGKQATFGLMGRAGYERIKARIDETTGTAGRVIGPSRG
ncbi:MAG: glucose-6-phosphate isomerase [Phycisphaeraceae bacterium]|nr:glucose-6-phosphate isomerase [Phycisphaeraceae bacterium]